MSERFEYSGDPALRERVAAWEVAVREGGPEVTYWMDRESHTLVQFEGEGGVIRYTRQTPSPQPRRETR